MMPSVVYTIVYLVLCFFVIFPTTEIESIGFTVDNLCSRYFADNFLQHNMKLTTLKMLIHFTMPLTYVGYMTLMSWFNPEDFDPEVPVWVMFARCGVLAGFAILALLDVGTALYWSWNDWDNHPVVKQLRQFTTATMPNWRAVATNINDEYRRDTKMVVRLNAISRLVVTENWIVEIRMYGMNVAQQSNTVMMVYKVETQAVITDTFADSQYVNIAVHQLRPQEKKFDIRLNGTHYKDLRDHVRCPVIVLSSVKFQSLTDRFVDVFRQEVALNPTVPNPGALEDNCLACLQAQPDVKIEKHCLDVDREGRLLPDTERCQQCHCRPHWCLSCLANWFVSTQQRSEWDTWLSKKATCPMCRAKFCVLDVCYLENAVPQEQE
ncbi:transmembrane protein 129 [Anopheles cruzii]|uniref:transmembrane protein 129 n=1 Tax=Anopheles cruzii TaxID=68878 RepID=UPI0022EC7630|nr:transmembrane protein 129 [Anopheles cruzii]